MCKRIAFLAILVCTSSSVFTDVLFDQHADARRMRKHIQRVQQIQPGTENSAETAALIDVDSGRFLYEKLGNRRMRIASLTKIITAWIAVRSPKFNQTVTVSRNAVRQEGSSVYLVEGEKQTIRNLTYALMLRSGNDSAVAIAEGVAGSVDRFATMMNKEAQKAGAKHSHFVNPNGLDHPEHYSTAHDMALMTAAALHNPTFRAIVRTKYFTMPWPNQPWDRKMKNKNKLLFMSEADGVKTGYTKKAGRCLASSMTKDGHQVALIVLRDGNDWVDSLRLLRYGLTAFERKPLAEQFAQTVRIPVRYGDAATVAAHAVGNATYPLKQSEHQDVRFVVHAARTLLAPIRKNQVVGTVDYMFHGARIGSAVLKTDSDVKGTGFIGWLRSLFHRS
ncbi:hypothetical protein ATW55_09015 [Ferroacidibacillus organovorans]|uniref:serine-type D-Ala-D-Ala carboxypeptidase n=2 Tax=Ferroacidibacillus organovorans TaxID=1765683 RepID=A0A101XQU2_9BACL|nr:hypothetical protein ATW55_09015 [Ferroacidibacillus organovorans]